MQLVNIHTVLLYNPGNVNMYCEQYSLQPKHEYFDIKILLWHSNLILKNIRITRNVIKHVVYQVSVKLVW